jgi:ATP-dependent Lon protease
MILKIRDKKVYISDELPVLPTGREVVLPYSVVDLAFDKDIAIEGIERAMMGNRTVFLAVQRDASSDKLSPDNLLQIGTVAEILRAERLPDGKIRVYVQGLTRARIREFIQSQSFFQAKVEQVEENFVIDPYVKALMRTVISKLEEYSSYNKKIPQELIVSLSSIEDPGKLSDIVASRLPGLELEAKRTVLETENPVDRLLKLIQIIEGEIEIANLEKEIQEEVRKRVEKSQRDYYLSEQLKVIQQQLGRGDELSEIEELRAKIKEAKMPPEVEEKAMRELERLEKMMPNSAEATVSRTYLDWLISLPWSIRTEDKLDIEEARRILDEDHYGLEKPKNRILEYLAVRHLSKDLKSPILCFVGPPGVGKTSLGKSIARALGRNFVRVSLGGVRDEAEIRGHRRTYIGALPGKIIQGMRRAKSKNPVFLLDEVDKMSVDFRGDPSAALLEVLDPEQNHAFNDHYIDVDFDLSEVLFITTANTTYSIPAPLLDRMEVIHLPGYTEYEKLRIAQKFLIPKQIKAHGLDPSNITITPSAIQQIINRYTREAGVRNLEREIATICRKVAKEVVTKGKELKVKVTARNIHKFLGPPRFRYAEAMEESEVGMATGLAVTEAGGDVLYVEATAVPGKGRFVLTGKLGEVMKESAQAALSYIRSRTEMLGIQRDFYKKFDIHIHIPEGAIPKDGPSAGITMAIAMISALSKRPVRKDVAMTGEITLRGKVLPIGGVKEKVLAAHRAGIRTVILPKDNEKDLSEIPKPIRRQIELVLVKEMDEVIELAFVKEEGRVAA